MKNRFSLLCSAALLLASSVCAQTEVRMDMYVPLFNSGEWYDSQNFESWEPGQNPEENFFISRVRPRERFVNEKTQVYPAEDAKGKKVLWWMPVSNGDPVHLEMFAIKTVSGIPCLCSLIPEVRLITPSRHKMLLLSFLPCCLKKKAESL